MHPKDISILEYNYNLPDDRIAAFPLAERDQSKLLIYKDGSIVEDIYKNLAAYLPVKSLLVFNDTRVIQARILFTKNTGSVIEIFCLEPHEDVKEYSSLMLRQEKLQWKCLIGGANKWKEGALIKSLKIQGKTVELKATLIEKLAGTYIVEFSWSPIHFSFAEVIEQAGDTPLPPYIKRKTEETDKERYQTIYAKQDGSVAAPTAGLHFTPEIFASFKEKNIAHIYVTLHVGAGTFKPVKAVTLELHEMHAEWIDVAIDTIKAFIDNDSNIIAVGTTSLRTIESLYWMGVKTILNSNCTIGQMMINQWDVYAAPLENTNHSAIDSFTSLLNWMKQFNYERIVCQTQILIAPGYRFKVAKAIVTNFHQPQSTLLLLVSAAIGEDWKKVYTHAMDNDYRFLSYGDGSLLFIK